MSDERIDLTQFESKHGTELYQKIQDYIRGNDYPDEIPLRIMGLYSGLLAELKRCYEEITLVHRNLSIVRNALARGYPDIEEEIWKLIDASE